MHISLIGTVHAENGRANLAELRAILERLQPDVIFAEIPTANLADYLDGSHGTLESAAVALYRKHRSVDVVPVDLNKPNDEFFRESKEMFKKVERTSPRYRRLMDQNSLNTRDRGFHTLTVIIAPKHPLLAEASHYIQKKAAYTKDGPFRTTTFPKERLYSTKHQYSPPSTHASR